VKLATIETVSELLPIANADAIELANVLGWQTIVKKGQFEVGQRAVFIPIDTILPDAPWSAFLKKGDAPIRLKTICRFYRRTSRRGRLVLTLVVSLV